MQYRLRTVLIVLALGPPVLAGLVRFPVTSLALAALAVVATPYALVALYAWRLAVRVELESEARRAGST